MIALYNESYTDTVRRLQSGGRTVDLVITSPPYNTNKKQGKTRTLMNTDGGRSQAWVRYDTVQDNMTTDQYSRFMAGVLDEMDKVLSENGVVLINLSYGNENSAGIWQAVAHMIDKTAFTVADCIVWKKKAAMPNNCSPNRLTRICEFVFVFVRKSEAATFRANKRVVSVRRTGQKSYGNVLNYIEARNNDGPCPFNKATFSSDLVGKLLDIYAGPGAVVYDPFMGSGTTAAECKRRGITCYGSEISGRQYEWAMERLEAVNV